MRSAPCARASAASALRISDSRLRAAAARSFASASSLRAASACCLASSAPRGDSRGCAVFVACSTRRAAGACADFAVTPASASNPAGWSSPVSRPAADGGFGSSDNVSSVRASASGAGFDPAAAASRSASRTAAAIASRCPPWRHEARRSFPGAPRFARGAAAPRFRARVRTSCVRARTAD